GQDRLDRPHEADGQEDPPDRVPGAADGDQRPDDGERGDGDLEQQLREAVGEEGSAAPEDLWRVERPEQEPSREQQADAGEAHPCEPAEGRVAHPTRSIARSGIRPITLVPAPGALRTSNEPPTAASLSAIPWRPVPPTASGTANPRP